MVKGGKTDEQRAIESEGRDDEITLNDVSRALREQQERFLGDIGKRTDWDVMAEEVNALIGRLRRKPKNAKCGVGLSSGSILNAYVEGDITFKQAVKMLEQWKRRKQTKK
jgi:hypothetical protein